jgi:Tfp pilus assembly PilM family ATPase
LGVFLVNNREINSTEKLLDVIRGKNEESFNNKDKQETNAVKKKPAQKIKITFPGILTDKKEYTVGIDIGNEFIKLAKTVKASDGRPVLVDHKIINFNQQTTKDSPEFKELLKSSLISFCGNLAKCNFWTLMSAAEVNVHHIKIPRVAKKQIENAVYWTAKKENPVDEKDFIFDFELRGEIIDQGIPKNSVMVYTAPKSQIDKIKTLFSEIDIPLAGITIAPFAIQNIFRTKWLQPDESTVASLFIGNDFSRIDIYHKENLVMTRGIKTGASSMMEAITESILEKQANKVLEKAEAKKILFSLGPDSQKLIEGEVGYELTEEEIYAMILPVMERLVRQLERTLEHYSSVVGQEKVGKIYVSSAMNVFEPIVNYIREQLGIKSEMFDPFKNHISCKDTESVCVSERMSLVPVVGLSLADNLYTPNVIFTYREKNKDIGIKRLNRGIFAGAAVIFLICMIVLVYQVLEVTLLSKQRIKLEKEFNTYSSVVTTDQIKTIVNELKTQQQISRQYAEKYLAVAAIGELATLTPSNIKLVSFKLKSANTSTNEKSEKAGKEDNEGVTLDGIIFGDRNMLDSLLAQYVMKLENSPMLRQVKLEKSSIINFKKSEVLQFTVNAKIG